MYWSSSGQSGFRVFGDGRGRDADGFLVQLPMGKQHCPKKAMLKENAAQRNEPKGNSHTEDYKP
jgi:hypothetical protein